jgi:hypothetical protein
LEPRRAKKDGSALARLRLNRTADQQLQPADIHNLRREFAEIIALSLPSFREHMSGKKEWSQNRLMAFKLLVSRVIPEVSQTFAQIEVTNRNVLELSVSELAAIARSGTAEPITLEHHPSPELTREPGTEVDDQPGNLRPRHEGNPQPVRRPRDGARKAKGRCPGGVLPGHAGID